MEQKNYKLPSNKIEYITAAARRYFPAALSYCQAQGKTACKVYRMSYWFDFASCVVRIQGPGDDRWWKYNMVEC